MGNQGGKLVSITGVRNWGVRNWGEKPGWETGVRNRGQKQTPKHHSANSTKKLKFAMDIFLRRRNYQILRIYLKIPQIFWQPLGRFDFPLGCPWLVHRKQHNREENSANPKLALRRCAFPLKCGQNTKTTAGHLMTMGALEPSCSIIEQAN